jgi:hypothetical protein
MSEIILVDQKKDTRLLDSLTTHLTATWDYEQELGEQVYRYRWLATVTMTFHSFLHFLRFQFTAECLQFLRYICCILAFLIIMFLKMLSINFSIRWFWLISTKFSIKIRDF